MRPGKRKTAEGEAVAAACKALSSPTRLRVFEIIRMGPDRKLGCAGDARPMEAPADSVCVCEILSEAPNVSPPTISHHLKELRNAGLVEATRCGQWQYYSARREAMEALGGYFLRTINQTKGRKDDGKRA
jgi:DNA-binding transcriptional ArsR family regulator